MSNRSPLGSRTLAPSGSRTLFKTLTAHRFPRLLAELRALVYTGLYDLDANLMGTVAWLQALDWPGRDAELARSARTPWVRCRKQFGQVQAVGNLTVVVVTDAGHAWAHGCPQAALDMFNTFVKEKASRPHRPRFNARLRETPDESGQNRHGRATPNCTSRSACIRLAADGQGKPQHITCVTRVDHTIVEHEAAGDERALLALEVRRDRALRSAPCPPPGLCVACPLP